MTTTTAVRSEQGQSVYQKYQTEVNYDKNSSSPILEGQPDFNEKLLSRIEKADRRIGVISADECINRARESFRTNWMLNHG
jgi:hypothetical protein